MLNTVKKIGPVLDLFTIEQPRWRMTDIARALDIPKSSTHALVTTLAEVGLLSVEADGSYRLGWNLLSLAERMRASLDYREHALPSMRDLSKTTRETVLLAALDRHEVVYVERVEGTHPTVRLAGVRIGSRIPAYATGVGKVLLAHRNPTEVRLTVEAGGMRRLTDHTITSIEQLEEVLADVRHDGYAVDHGEAVSDVACVAVPIKDAHGTVISALSVSMPAYRFPKDPRRLAGTMKASAELISARIASASEQAPPLARPDSGAVVDVPPL